MGAYFVGLESDGRYCLRNLQDGTKWQSGEIDFIAIICTGKLGKDFEKLVTYEVSELLAKDGCKNMLPADIEKFNEIVRRSLSRCSNL